MWPFKSKPKGTVKYEIYIREQGVNAWPIFGASPKGNKPIVHLSGAVIHTEATPEAIKELLQSGSCLRGFPGDVQAVLREKKEINMTLEKAKEFLRGQ